MIAAATGASCIRYAQFMKRLSLKNGISTNEVTDWNDFLVFVNKYLEYNHFVWRGQADSSWLLEPTFDRIMKENGKTDSKEILNSHLERFKYAIRGRRGINPPQIETENDWWALGQHHGLNTPLLDWTKSPFVASYFAMVPKLESSTNFRVIYGISQTTIKIISAENLKKNSAKKKESIVEFINPLSDENNRLVNQMGLFTRTPNGIDLESWYRENIEEKDGYARMWKILIPESERITALRSLNRMNINHATLFPDIYGASKYVNVDLEIDNY